MEATLSSRCQLWCWFTVKTRSLSSTSWRRLKDETDGLTLVELIVYGIILSTVLLIVGSILVSSLSIQRVVQESTEATTAAQLAVTSIEAGVRNASAVNLTSVGSDQLLEVRTVGSDPSSAVWRCQAWYYSAANGTLRMTSTASDATSVTAPTAEPNTWILLTSNISAPTSGVIFTNSGNSVTIYFQATTKDSEPVDIRSSSVVRAGVWESGSCF